MGRAKSKQSLARRNVSGGSVYRGTGNQADPAKRDPDRRESKPAYQATTTAEAITSAARIDVSPEAGRLDTETQVRPSKPAREFEARSCTICAGIRPHGKNYSRVYCTRGNVRYCKCGFCGNTWAQQG